MQRDDRQIHRQKEKDRDRKTVSEITYMKRQKQMLKESTANQISEGKKIT